MVSRSWRKVVLGCKAAKKFLKKDTHLKEAGKEIAIISFVKQMVLWLGCLDSVKAKIEGWPET